MVLVDPRRVDTCMVENCPFSEIIDEVVTVDLTISSFIVLVDPRSVETFIVEN
jgi:hypothetical protein